MKSWVASLRSLTLPYGVTSGVRMILDGVRGRISIYDATNAEVVRLDAATAAYTATAANGSRVDIWPVGPTGGAEIDLTPPAETGHTWDRGWLSTQVNMGGNPGVYITSPSDSGSVTSTTRWEGGGLDANNVSRITDISNYRDMTADQVTIIPATQQSTLIDVTGSAVFTGTVTAANIPASGNFIAFGSSAGLTDASGDRDIGAAIASATGWTTINGAVCWNGAGGARPNLVIANMQGTGGYGTSWKVRHWLGNSGAVVAGLASRIDWMAWGH